MILTRKDVKKFGLAVLIGCIVVGTISAQSTEFTYQGSLKDGASPATGSYDFEFRLFDALTVGNQIGTAQARNATVTGGLFSVSLDFGAQFPGSDRYLEIRVRPTGGASYTLLDPRQRISSAPYSVKSLTATNSTQLGGVAAGQYVITTDPRMTDARNPLPGSSSYIQNSTVPQGSSSFNISDNGTVGGTLSGNIVSATTQYNLGGARVFHLSGIQNTFVGVGAGSGGAGRSNSFFGSGAGLATSTGQVNSFFGAGSGIANTTGGANSFFGASSGQSNTTGNLNSFFGQGAGADNTTGTGNAFFGASAGNANTSAISNSFFGAFAGASNTTGSFNSFFGEGAGTANTFGGSNSFFGRDTGEANTTGGLNSFFGARAGESNTTGSNNSFFGANAGASHQTTPDNSFFGASAGNSNMACCNSFFGAFAGESNTSGTDNSFFGRRSGIMNTEGRFNSFFGTSSGDANTTGEDNAFFGAGAGGANTTGNRNSFFGRSAGFSNTTGNSNTIIGNTANVGAGNLIFATAIGAGAVVSTSSTIQLGRSNGLDTVIVSGILRVGDLANAGATALCRNASDGIGTCSSSARYKTNINDFDRGLDLIRRLRPVSFTWRESGESDFGLVAEEVALVEPLLVTYNKDGQVEGVKYDRVGVALVNTAKQQQAEIERLAEVIRLQQKQIDALKKLVCASSTSADVCKEN